MTTEAYWDARSSALAAAGLDPEGDDWALPDNDEASSFVEDYRAQMMRLEDDPWGDDEEEA